MDKKKRYLFIVNLCISALGVVFISAALGTENWIIANPIRRVGDDVEDAARNVSDDEDRFKGRVNIGLFAGHKEINYGFGDRKYRLEVNCEPKENLCAYIIPESDDDRQIGVRSLLVKYEKKLQQLNQLNGTSSNGEHGMFNFSLWVCTIFFAAVAITWGVVAMGFAAFNAGTRPIEMITGPLGLYIWNSAAALSCVLCLVMYIILYVQDFSINVMSPEDLEDLWTSDGYASLNYSFYFIVISTVLFIANIILLAIFRTECKLFSSRYSTSVTEKAMDGVMMY